MIFIYLLYLTLGSSENCTEIDIGTDPEKTSDIVQSGEVQEGWKYHDASHKSEPSEDYLYFYLQDNYSYEISSFHHEDEHKPEGHKFVFMNITLDEMVKEGSKSLSAYKVTQECIDRIGSTTVHMNITFSARSCQDITIAWLKLCGEEGSTLEGLNIGFSPKSHELVENGDVKEGFNIESTKGTHFVVKAEVESTRLFLYKNPTQKKVYFEKPSIITDHEVMLPEITGAMADGGWLENEPLDLQIKYNCVTVKKEYEEIELLIKFPYYHALRIRFFKHCWKDEIDNSVLSLKHVVVFFIVVALAVCGKLLYDKYTRGEIIIDTELVKRQVSSAITQAKSKLRSKESSKQPEEQELPDASFEDLDSPDTNLRSVYGTF